MTLTPEEAVKLACPLTLAKNAPMKCQAQKCMAWVWSGAGVVRLNGEDVRKPLGRCGMVKP